MTSINVRELCEGPELDFPEWIGNGVLPKGQVLLLGGETKIGKTWIGFEIADALGVGVGRNLFGDPRFPIKEKARVLLVDAELGLYGAAKRFRMRWTHNDIKPPPQFWCAPRGTYAPLRVNLTGWKDLAKMIAETKTQVVILDPASYFISDGKNESVRDFYENLSRIQQEIDPDISFVVVHHFNKPPRGREADGSDPLDPYRFSGAANWINDPSAVMTGNKEDTTDIGIRWYIHARMKLRHGPEPEDFKIAVMNNWELLIAQDAAAAEPPPRRFSQALARLG